MDEMLFVFCVLNSSLLRGSRFTDKELVFKVDDTISCHWAIQQISQEILLAKLYFFLLLQDGWFVFRLPVCGIWALSFMALLQDGLVWYGTTTNYLVWSILGQHKM